MLIHIMFLHRTENQEKNLVSTHNPGILKAIMYQVEVLLEKVLFVIDSGASYYIIKSCYKKYLSEGSDVNFDISVATAGESLNAVNKGNITCFSDGDYIKIRDVLICENLSLQFTLGP
ncbi:hypothetical protein PR048_013328 [Dryococelus australis]|uniref:Uncharacterized protein n=1 Tax=Dryococelus australis TaxID=614101 RepID=A0ABQ9HRV0_9NEOP|nr:hypothetical protein PR048_013328 [Dryococelus australis]